MDVAVALKHESGREPDDESELKVAPKTPMFPFLFAGHNAKKRQGPLSIGRKMP
jgi:hypothetical protein